MGRTVEMKRIRIQEFRRNAGKESPKKKHCENMRFKVSGAQCYWSQAFSYQTKQSRRERGGEEAAYV